MKNINLLLNELRNNNRLYNDKYVDVSQQPQFFGEKLNIARNDLIKYPKLDQYYRTQFSFFWNPEEIDLKQDARDWKKMTDIDRRIYEKNIAYQILLDSIQERAPALALLPYASLPEVEALTLIWPFYENIHSKSYQHILRSVFVNPSEVFDDVINDTEIRDRAEAVVKPLDELIEYAQLYSLFGEGECKIVKNDKEISLNLNKYNLYKLLYIYLVTTYFLESIRFYVSFVCSFYFAAQRNIMKGGASIITLIARDEKLHTAISLTIINNLKLENDPIMMKVISDCKDLVIEIFYSVMDQERQWIKYLFKDGSLLGLNEEILTQYLEMIGGNRLNNLIKYNPYKHISHPCSWVESYFNPKAKTSAPQEMEITEYLIGAMSMEEFDQAEFDNLLRLTN